MTVPVIRALVLQNPNIKITFVSRPFYKPFFDDIPNVNFFEIDLKKRHKGFLGLVKLYLDLKKLHIDAVADLHDVIRSQIIRKLFALGGKKIVFIDKDRKGKDELTRLQNKIFKPLKSTVNRYIDTFEKLDLKVDMSYPQFPKKAILSETITSITGQKTDQNWIGIAPFAQYKSKIYPQDLMQKVIDELANKNHNKIFLFGAGAQEINILNQFSDGKKNVLVIAGKFGLKQELELISNLNVMLSMDSANGHIAAMMGIKVVTLWGSTHPYAGFLPFNQPSINSLIPDIKQFPLLPTSIYGNKIFSGYEDAMRTIKVDNVISKLQNPETL